MRVARRHTLGVLVSVAAVFAGSCANSIPASSAADAGAAAAEPGIRGISYIGISVSDVDAATSYFTKGANLPEITRGDLSASVLSQIAGKPVAARTRTLESGSGRIRLMQFSNRSGAAAAAGIVPVQGPGITHVCFQSPDSKPIFPGFVAAGAKPLSRTGDLVQLRPDVPVKYAYLRDGDGTMIEIEQLLLDNLPFAHRMRHVAIASIDIDRAVAFYTALLGVEPRERRSNLVNKTLDTTADLDDLKLDVAWFRVGNLELEIWEYLNPAPVASGGARPLEAYGHNMIVFDTADPGAALARVKSQGGKRVAAPSPMDDGQIAFGRDPDGNLLGFFRPASANSPFATQALIY